MNAYQTGPTGTNPKGYGGEVSDTSSERQGYDEDGNARPWTVLPGGRGSEQHGVPFTGTPDNDGYPVGDSSGVSGRGALGDDTVPIEPLATEPEPIPVRIVRSGARELQRLRTTLVRVVGSGVAGDPQAGNPVMVVAKNASRQALVTIVNTSVDTTVYLSHDPAFVSTPKAGGFALLPQSSVQVVTDEAVWAGAASFASSLLAVTLANAQVVTTNTTIGSTFDTTTVGSNVSGISFLVDFPTVSGTTPTVVFSVQASENGTDWVQVAASSAQTAAGEVSLTVPGPVARFYRVVSTAIGGTTPSYTTSVFARASVNGAVQVVGAAGVSGIAEVSTVQTVTIEE